MSHGDLLWSPPADVRERSQIGRYLTWLERERGRSFDGYAELWRWSVDDLPGFWSSIWDHFALGGPDAAPLPEDGVLEQPAMPGARWLPHVELSWAERALSSGVGDQPAVISVSQSRPDVTLTFDELRAEVARCRTGLRRLGVGRGDRVVAYLPNVAETLVAFLATASLGAVWASCAPEFGTPRRRWRRR